jgi:protein TilB
MGFITEELLRKSAEHNDKVLADLEEVSLHQRELEGIDNIERCCRHLRILYLQNNIINKLEGLNKLKELEYLNMALNNVQIIEGIENCESLNKLDMTCNFVDIEFLQLSVYNLKANVMLEDLYMMGNPCMEWPGARDYIVASLPQLKQLDGKLVPVTERIQARQQLKALEAQLEELSQENLKRKAEERARGLPVSEGAYTIENRNEMYKEMEEQKLKKEQAEKERMGLGDKPKRELPGVMNARGDIRQCNEGKYDFRFDEPSDAIVLEIGVPRHLDTEMIDVDVNPLYVRCVIKEKVTQLKVPNEVLVSKSTVKRSKTTGWLSIRMPLAKPREAFHFPKEPEEPELQPLEPKPVKLEPEERQLKGSVSLGICGSKDLIKERQVKRKDEEPFVDDPDVPPLEAIAA